MPRLALLPLCLGLAALLGSGCQTTSPSTARAERVRPATFWSADGQASNAKLVSSRGTKTPTRLASRSSRESGSSLGGLVSGGRAERSALPRAIDTARGASDESIGAF